ncbi:MAG: response regulator transcription factor [Proteobacteria bacterium]|nr:response regulator transcription factor [Pseudomonadota bacterium]
MSKIILVIEDNADLGNLLSLHLRDLNFEVVCEPDGRKGLRQAESHVFDLIILDIMLPGMDGIEILRQIRGKGNAVPILMLTSKSSETDRVVGLELGADDYVTKPFSIRELLARVKALLRRAEADQPKTIVEGELVICPEKRTVSLSGKSIDVTAKEFDLLYYFASHPGRAYSRSQLLDQIWGYAHSGYEHTVNSHINRLRSKIEKNPAKPRYILTVWGVGYKFADENIP